MLADYEAQLAERDKAIQQRDSRYKELMESVDPEKLIPDKLGFAAGQLKEKYQGMSRELLSKIQNADLATMDKLEALVILDKLSVSSNVSDSIRKEEILKGLGIEDTEDLTENDRYRIEREYARQAKTLNEIKEFQPDYSTLPLYTESKEHQEKRSQQLAELKTRNESAVKKILAEFGEATSQKNDWFKYVVSQEWKDNHLTEFVNALTNNMYDVEQNMEEVKMQIDREFKMQNFDNIMTDVRKQALAEANQAAHNEIHSNTPTNTAESPTTQAAPPKTLRDAIKDGSFKKVIRNY